MGHPEIVLWCRFIWRLFFGAGLFWRLFFGAGLFWRLFFGAGLFWRLFFGAIYFVVRLALRAGSNSSFGFQLMVVGAVRASQPSSMPKRSSLALPAKSQSGW